MHGQKLRNRVGWKSKITLFSVSVFTDRLNKDHFITLQIAKAR